MKSRVRAALGELSQATLLQIEDRLGPALEAGLLDKPSSKAHSRQRIFSLRRIFWSWIWQIYQTNTSCREVVRQVQALVAVLSHGHIDEGTSAYCRARQKLPTAVLENALASTHRKALAQAPAGTLLRGRPLKVVDGSAITVPDSEENRRAFPPSKSQSPKPTFPIMKIVAIFCAASGSILAKAIGSCQSELRLLMGMGASLAPGDILIGDRHFGCFVLAAWLKALKVDLLARVGTKSRRVDFTQALKVFIGKDALFVWTKPAPISPLLTREQWEALPMQITVRIITVRVEQKGFRTTELTVVTTLLDPELYPAQEILDAYLRRWRMEMCLDDLKTTLGMQMLNCRSPQLLEKELLIFLISHNMMRWMMAQAASQHEVDIELISFKGTLDTFRQWSAGLVQIHGPGKKIRRDAFWRQFLYTLAADLLPLRPGRCEPRAVKKRSKYPPLSHPRAIYRGRPSRGTRRVIATAKKHAATAKKHADSLK